MDINIKHFIEDNIRDIGLNNWNKVFYNYVHMPSYLTPSIKWFIKILDEADIDYYKQFLRIDLTKEQFIETLDLLSEIAKKERNAAKHLQTKDFRSLVGRENLFNKIAYLGKQLGYNVYEAIDVFAFPAYFFIEDNLSLKEFIDELRSAGFNFEDDQIVKI